ncbi:MAG: pectate lyase [Bacteroidales bacterium]|nr:pectate lyase [Bacteroidales bacterium]
MNENLSYERIIKIELLFIFCIFSFAVFSQEKTVPPVRTGIDGKLEYFTDSLGNRIPDFSWCGYMNGNQPVPNVPVRAMVSPVKGDATYTIQAAIDYVAGLPPGENGLRGAVLLEKGVFEVDGQLFMNKSGVVLRGCGTSRNGTTIIGKGKTRNTLIVIGGVDDKKFGIPVRITDGYVPVNAATFSVSNGNDFKPGDKVLVHRPSTKEWIDKIQMNEFGGESSWLGWKPGTRDLYWDRTITSVLENKITLDATLTTSLDSSMGGGFIAKYDWPGRIYHVGIENLQLVSDYDSLNPKDEDHRWMAVTIENAGNCWVRQVSFRHFAGSAVSVYETASKITVEDCKSLAPFSEIGGFRRTAFFTSGQMVLFQRCYSEYGYHDFVAGFCAAGPNAFVQCESYMPYNFSGPTDSWSSGVLYDIVNVDGQKLCFSNLLGDKQGAGWNAANSVFWQCSAAKIECFSPPGAVNYAVGCWAQFSGNGYWYEPDSHVKPRSLYYAQLSDRLGNSVQNRANLLPLSTEASSSPTIAQAMEFAASSVEPQISLIEWIELAKERNPIPLTSKGARVFSKSIIPENKIEIKKQKIIVENGLLICEGMLITGLRHNVSWWRGNIRPFAAKKATPHITRFVPGRTGTGFTDNLDSVASWMFTNNILSIEHNYGLWYDRRRDDHERIRRIDGDVWAPFYELPFARSGQGTAWDGLSKYDLTRFNFWYWDRLKQFADLADKHGLLLIQQHYFQHNILEAGAHWADFPWRDANNINHTGFPEPPPYAGDKRIFMAEQFYDTGHPVRRKIHEAYIRKCLDNFSSNTNVIHSISAEYTGPLHFVQFWIDVIMEWEKETGKNALVMLSVTKDVQDSILADKARSEAVDIIDIHYWHYRKDGSLYAPEGGKNLAPRQHARLVKQGESSFEQVYRAVSEYRERFPFKAVVYSASGSDKYSGAVLKAGGSMPSIPVTEKNLKQ